MNELQAKTIKLEPAVVEFNHLEIEKELSESLSKYEGLTFDEENTTKLRGTLAYLRKGRAAVDDYRKNTKRVLTESVKEFEDKCKDLTGQFDNVINPLNQQLKEFTEAERDKKLGEIKVIREELLLEHGLDREYHDQVTIEPQYTNKGTSITAVKDSIEFQIKNLKLKQDKLMADKEMISMTVKLSNSENGLSLTESAYVRLLEFDDVETVKSQIEKDVAHEIEVKERVERLEKERVEREERLEKERIERDERLEKERVEQEEQRLIEEEARKLSIAATKALEEVKQRQAYEEVPLSSAPTSVSIDDLPFNDPFGDFECIAISDDISLDMFDDELFNVRKVYEVFATESQLEKLQKFMSENDIEWGVLNE